MLFARQGPGCDYERVLVVQQRRVGLRAIVALHSTRRGPGFGGIRRMRYADEAAALADALELSEAMSHKCALAGLPAGGAKTVVLMPDDPQAFDRAGAYEALGRAIAQLGGQYVCGPDLGTGDPELSVVRRVCAHVNPPDNDAGASTAAGVHAGLRAVWRVLGSSERSERRVAIQGLGSVGLALAVALRGEGVQVVGADPSEAACRAAAQAGVTIVAPEVILTQPCDVLSPCAVGHVLDEAAIAGLRCRAVCGSANNQLRSAEDGRRLHERGIVCAPDVVVSAGAVIEGVLTVTEGPGARVRARVHEAIAGIEGTLHEILTEAARQDRPPVEVARSRARQRLADGA